MTAVFYGGRTLLGYNPTNKKKEISEGRLPMRDSVNAETSQKMKDLTSLQDCRKDPPSSKNEMSLTIEKNGSELLRPSTSMIFMGVHQMFRGSRMTG